MLRNIITALIIMSVSKLVSAAPLTEKQITESLENNIRMVQHMALNPLLVKAVRQQNAQNLNIETITQRDRDWRLAAEASLLKTAMQVGDHAVVMRRFVERNRTFSGVFLADNQGANVAAYPLPDDYWQGDEDEWEKSFNSGNGRIFVGPLKLDEKTKTISAYVSAPVLDREKTIGVLVVGVSLDGTQ